MSLKRIRNTAVIFSGCRKKNQTIRNSETAIKKQKHLKLLGGLQDYRFDDIERLSWVINKFDWFVHPLRHILWVDIHQNFFQLRAQNHSLNWGDCCDGFHGLWTAITVKYIHSLYTESWELKWWGISNLSLLGFW